MKFLISQKYNWKHMFSDVEKFVKKCDVCQKSGLAKPNTKNKIILTEEPNQPWECDLIGPLPKTFNPNKYILVCIDHYSKWIETIPIKSKDAGIDFKRYKKFNN